MPPKEDHGLPNSPNHVLFNRGVGVCRHHPLYYLGKEADHFAFWWDDGDIYHAGSHSELVGGAGVNPRPLHLIRAQRRRHGPPYCEPSFLQAPNWGWQETELAVQKIEL